MPGTVQFQKLRRLLSVAMLFGIVVCPGRAQEEADEYSVKAAFLYNFAKFVEWPAQAFSGPTDPVAICVFGQNPFGTALEAAVKGKTVGARPFAVRQVTEATQALKCHILFVGDAERRWRSLLPQLKDSSILTVGETEGFTAAGGMINFWIKDTRVRIEIAAEAAERVKLRISSKLLSLAERSRGAH